MLQVADGVSTVLNFEQLRPLINRLNSGQPINVVAFGDSVTASFGECLPSDSEGHEDLLYHRRNRWACGIVGHLTLCAQTFAATYLRTYVALQPGQYRDSQPAI